MSQQINLFNPIFLKEKKYFSALTMAQALGMILVGVLLLSVYSAYQSRSLTHEAANATTQLANVKQQLAKINAEYGARKKTQSLEDEAKKAQDEQAALQQALVRLQNEEFGNRKGYSAYLRAFSRQIVEGLWLTGFSIDGGGSAIGIQGRALQPEVIPAYINRLKQETVIQGVSFATLEIQQPQDRKPQDANASTEQKTGEQPSFIEFDLRSAGVEKAAPKAPASGVADVAVKPRVEVPALAPVPAPVAAQSGAKE
jgi:hypothetical protein